MVDDFSNSQITINCNKSCELLNSVKYNYGKLTDSQSCCSFQKTSNRLAICTEKSLIIINLNLNWPKVNLFYFLKRNLNLKNKFEAFS